MEKVTQWIAENPVISTWITLISLLGVIITIIALILQIKDKKRRAIYYTMASNVLIDNEVSKIEGIKVLFNEKEVSTIVVSNVKVWNGGNEIIEQTDFYPENELKLIIPSEEKILAASIVTETEKTCKFNIKMNDYEKNEAIISFYCLEPGQGATVNIYHTNLNDEYTKIVGKIKGGKLVNKSFEIITEDGEIYISTDRYKFYLDRGVFGIGISMKEVFQNLFGISIKKKK